MQGCHLRSIRRVLVVQPYGIGDALFVTPVLRRLRLVPTVEAVDLLLGSRTEALFRNNPHVDQIFSIDKDRWHTLGRVELVKEFFAWWKKLQGRYDLLIDFSLQREYGFYSSLFLRIPRRLGFNFRGRGLFLTASLPLPQGFAEAPVVDFYCRVLGLLGLEVEERFPEFYLSDEDREEGQRTLRSKSISDRFILVAPGGGESWGNDAIFKRWPPASFVEMISLLKGRVNFESIVVLGSRGERALGEEICRDASEGRGERVVNLCGEVSLGGAAALLEKSLLFLANDGGLVHLAHALHRPLIAFYGPVDPQVYGPYPSSKQAIAVVKKSLPCRPCYLSFRYNSFCVDRECLAALRPDEVFEFLDKKDFWSVLCQRR